MYMRSKVILTVRHRRRFRRGAAAGRGERRRLGRRPLASQAGGASARFGFKLIWDAPNYGDSFIDAVWAYHYP
jgi:hypothetical protein